MPGERWLTILMNRINPGLFAAPVAAWVRESWPEKASLVAIDGKTSRRSHDRSSGSGPLHLASALPPRNLNSEPWTNGRVRHIATAYANAVLARGCGRRLGA